MFEPKKKNNINRLVVSALLGGWYLSDSGNSIIKVRVTLKNLESDTIEYLNMLCNQAAAYTLDITDFNFINYCTLDKPDFYKTDPLKDNVNFFCITTNVSYKNWQKIIFRIGFNFVSHTKGNNLDFHYSKLLKKENIIWSDTLYLSDFLH